MGSVSQLTTKWGGGREVEWWGIRRVGHLGGGLEPDADLRLTGTPRMQVH